MVEEGKRNHEGPRHNPSGGGGAGKKGKGGGGVEKNRTELDTPPGLAKSFLAFSYSVRTNSSLHSLVGWL